MIPLQLLQSSYPAFPRVVFGLTQRRETRESFEQVPDRIQKASTVIREEVEVSSQAWLMPQWKHFSSRGEFRKFTRYWAHEGKELFQTVFRKIGDGDMLKESVEMGWHNAHQKYSVTFQSDRLRDKIRLVLLDGFGAILWVSLIPLPGPSPGFLVSPTFRSFLQGFLQETAQERAFRERKERVQSLLGKLKNQKQKM